MIVRANLARRRGLSLTAAASRRPSLVASRLSSTKAKASLSKTQSRTLLALSTLSGFIGYTLLSFRTTEPAHAEADRAPPAAPSTGTGTGPADDPPVGVYLWGDNKLKITAPSSDAKLTKTPTRLPFFDNVYLRDLKLGASFGAAIDAGGDLYMWGEGHSAGSAGPEPVLAGADLSELAVSKDRVIALSRRHNAVYLLPTSKLDQQAPSDFTFPRQLTPSSAPWWSWLWPPSYLSSGPARPPHPSSLNIRQLKPDLQPGERISRVRAGLYHALLLTTHGRLFSAAASATDYPSHGQLGIAGLRWDTRPAGPLDQCLAVAVPVPAGSALVDIAAGDFHSLAQDAAGNAYGFGDNSYGQLGFAAPDTAVPTVDAPALISFGNHYGRARRDAAVTKIAAGGLNSFFVVESVPETKSAAAAAAAAASSFSPTTPAPPTHAPSSTAAAPRAHHQHVVDLWAAGNGVTGSLGTGRWTHVQAPPALVTALSGLFEYSEPARRFFPLPITRISVGATHVAAVVDPSDTASLVLNRPAASSSSSSLLWSWLPSWGGEQETNVSAAGAAAHADVMLFGGNEFWQLGTGKRMNVPVPSFIPPLARKPDEVLQSVRPDRRLTVVQRKEVTIKGKKMQAEQRVEAGRGTTAAFWAVKED